MGNTMIPDHYATWEWRKDLLKGALMFNLSSNIQKSETEQYGHRIPAYSLFTTYAQLELDYGQNKRALRKAFRGLAKSNDIQIIENTKKGMVIHFPRIAKEHEKSQVLSPMTQMPASNQVIISTYPEIEMPVSMAFQNDVTKAGDLMTSTMTQSECHVVANNATDCESKDDTIDDTNGDTQPCTQADTQTVPQPTRKVTIPENVRHIPLTEEEMEEVERQADAHPENHMSREDRIVFFTAIAKIKKRNRMYQQSTQNSLRNPLDDNKISTTGNNAPSTHFPEGEDPFKKSSENPSDTSRRGVSNSFENIAKDIQKMREEALKKDSKDTIDDVHNDVQDDTLKDTSSSTQAVTNPSESQSPVREGASAGVCADTLENERYNNIYINNKYIYNKNINNAQAGAGAKQSAPPATLPKFVGIPLENNVKTTPSTIPPFIPPTASAEPSEHPFQAMPIAQSTPSISPQVSATLPKIDMDSFDNLPQEERNWILQQYWNAFTRQPNGFMPVPTTPEQVFAMSRNPSLYLRDSTGHLMAGYSKESASRFFSYYSSMNWTNSQGRMIPNWPQKMATFSTEPQTYRGVNNAGTKGNIGQRIGGAGNQVASNGRRSATLADFQRFNRTGKPQAAPAMGRMPSNCN